MRIIAKIADGVFIVAINDVNGFIVSEQGKVISPIMMYDAFIKFGNWFEADDDSRYDIEKLYEEALELTKSARLE